jgi:two-component system chemotaxis response regulator CheB
MNARAKVKVLIVEDSPVVQRLLHHVIASDSRLAVVGTAADAEEAMRLIEACRPDVISMDIRLPRIDGLQATRRIMRDHPLPIVVVAANVDDKVLDITMNALRAGALSVVEKPSSTAREDYQALAGHLCTQLYIMSQVKVVRQRGHGNREPPSPAPAPLRVAPELVAIVASTGGPGALVRILSSLCKDFPLPIVVVQHLGATFLPGFANWLGTLSALPVVLARQGEMPQPGHVHVAPGGAHLCLDQNGFKFDSSPPVQGQQPSGDVLFDSVAHLYGPRALGIVLTGMGEDGARGLLAMRRAGAHTIAEAQSTAVIWGMPGAAVALGAAVEQQPLDAIAARVSLLAAEVGA